MPHLCSWETPFGHCSCGSFVFFLQILQIVVLENYFRLLSLIMFWIFQIVLQGNFFEIVDLDHSFQIIQMMFWTTYLPLRIILICKFYNLSIWATFLQILVKFCTLSFRSTFICQLSCFESLFCKLFVVDHLLQTLKVEVLLNFFVNCRSGQFFLQIIVVDHFSLQFCILSLQTICNFRK